MPMLAQSGQVDSLLNLAQHTDHTSKKIELYIEVMEKLIVSNPSAVESIQKKIIYTSKSKKEKSLAYSKLGVFWYQQHQIDKSMEFYFLALDDLENTPENYDLLGSLNNNIGWNFQKQGDYDRALKYYQISKDFLINSNKTVTLGLLLNNIGVVYKNQKRYDDALRIFKESMKINRKDNNVKQLLFNINNIGIIYLNQKKYPLAIEYFSQALEINYQRKDLAEVANNIHNLGIAYNQLNQLTQASDSLLHALHISNDLGLTDLKRLVLKELYAVNEKQHNYKEALNYYIAFNSLDDSLYNKNQYTSLIELESKYKVSQQQRSLELSQNELLSQRLINALILGALIISVLGIVFLIWVFILKKRNEKLLIKLNYEIDLKNANIQAINQSLEAKVGQRTKTIKDQNEKLKEFAFINSHKIRRPLSSILGLINLLHEEKDFDRIKELTEMLDLCAKEMDSIVYEINQNLKEESFNS